MKQHFADISKIYELPEKPVAIVNVEDYARLLDENDFLYQHFGYGNENELRAQIGEKDRYIQYIL